METPQSPEEARRFQDEWLASRSKWGEQDENGDDVSLIEESLRLTMTERFERYKAAAKMAVGIFGTAQRS